MKIVLFIISILFLSCNANRNNYDQYNSEKIIFDIILNDIFQKNDNVKIFINHNYSFYTNREISAEESERIKYFYRLTYKKEIAPPKDEDEIIKNYLEVENIDGELIKAFINNRKNNKMITISIDTRFQFIDDKSEIKDKLFADQDTNKYLLIEISNICFNENRDKAILHIFVEYGTIPSSFVYTRSEYIIFEKLEDWKEIKRTSAWEGIS